MIVEVVVVVLFLIVVVVEVVVIVMMVINLVELMSYFPYFVKSMCYLSWQAQHFVEFMCHFAWQGQQLASVATVAGAGLLASANSTLGGEGGCGLLFYGRIMLESVT